MWETRAFAFLAGVGILVGTAYGLVRLAIDGNLWDEP